MRSPCIIYNGGIVSWNFSEEHSDIVSWGGQRSGISSPGDNIQLKCITHLCSGSPRPLRVGRSVEMAWCGGMLQAASVTAPARLLLSFWRPPRPHPPNRSAACPFSSGVNVWLQREDTRAPVVKPSDPFVGCGSRYTGDQLGWLRGGFEQPYFAILRLARSYNVPICTSYRHVTSLGWAMYAIQRHQVRRFQKFLSQR